MSAAAYCAAKTESSAGCAAKKGTEFTACKQVIPCRDYKGKPGVCLVPVQGAAQEEISISDTAGTAEEPGFRRRVNR
ncbi:hypothetical protein ABH899_001852 [Paenibacillus sp. RC84]